MTPREMYERSAELLRNLPDVVEDELPGRELTEWLARAFALVRETGDIIDTAEVRGAMTKIEADPRYGRDFVWRALCRVKAVAELQLPATEQGGFVLAGNVFDAYQVVTTVLRGAKQSVFMIDPYLDDTALFTFVAVVAERVPIKLLADESCTSAPALRNGVRRWSQQFGANRPLEARLTPRRKLHDRLLIVDGVSWIATQSFKDFAVRAPASLTRSPPDQAAMKIEAYEDLWNDSTPITP